MKNTFFLLCLFAALSGIAQNDTTSYEGVRLGTLWDVRGVSTDTLWLVLPTYDTVAVKMLVSQNNGIVYSINGYVVRESRLYGEKIYLDKRKKPLPKYFTVWQVIENE